MLISHAHETEPIATYRKLNLSRSAIICIIILYDISNISFSLYVARIVQRQVDNGNSTDNDTQGSGDGDKDDSGLSSGQIGGIAGGIGTLYIIYLGIGIGLYFYFFLEFTLDTYFDCLSTVLVALVLFAPYLLFITLLFPFFLLLIICLGAVCALGNNN